MLDLHIKKQFKGFSLDISFQSKEGCLGILGASGSGKSMTLKCIAGIERPDWGYIRLNERVLFDSKQKINLSPQERNAGYLFQNYALFPNMTVEENIGAGIKDRKAKLTQIKRQIEAFALTGLEKRYPAQLSGGQQQRVALARMLAHKPDIILLDEPFAALDGYLKEKMQLEMLRTLNGFSGDVLLVSHSRDDIYRFCPHVLAIDAGTTLQIGAIQDIFMRPKSYKVARLTGCNNITPAEKRGEYEILAKDWSLTLRTNRPVADNIRYVGLRAHDLCIGKSGDENVFEMKLEDVVESPFEYKYHICTVNTASKESIWWKTYKNLELDKTIQKFPCYVRLPKEKLLLLEA
ncbi:ATP-binding cassette domain-containing protein [Lachnospiraceae bacterium ZAX-1]